MQEEFARKCQYIVALDMLVKMAFITNYVLVISDVA